MLSGWLIRSWHDALYIQYTHDIIQSACGQYVKRCGNISFKFTIFSLILCKLPKSWNRILKHFVYKMQNILGYIDPWILINFRLIDFRTTWPNWFVFIRFKLFNIFVNRLLENCNRIRTLRFLSWIEMNGNHIYAQNFVSFSENALMYANVRKKRNLIGRLHFDVATPSFFHFIRRFSSLVSMIQMRFCIHRRKSLLISWAWLQIRKWIIWMLCINSLHWNWIFAL